MSDLCVVIPPRIMVTKHEHVLSFLCLYLYSIVITNGFMHLRHSVIIL